MRKISISDINPRLFETKRFRSTVQTPNSENYKNQNNYRLMAFTMGSATLEMCGRQQTVEKNDCLYLVPGERYRILNTHGDFEVLNIWFDFLSEDVKATVFNTVFDCDFDSSLSVEPCFISEVPELEGSALIKRNPRLCSMLENLNASYRGVDICRDIQIKAGLLNLISQIVLCLAKSKKYTKAAGEIIDYIQLNITEKITAESLAEHFHYHKNHVGRIIKNATGMTLKQYIISEKISYANHLLHETNLSMTEIANALSFYDYSHLSKYFNQDKHRQR